MGKKRADQPFEEDQLSQSDHSIPAQIYELASSYRVGTPRKRQRRSFIQIVLLFEILFGLFLLGWIGYDIYGYVAFSLLSHTYPDVNSVPDNQLGTYLQLQAIHDQFWPYMLQTVASLLVLSGHSVAFFSASRTKLYICTDGLLKIRKKKDEAVRWDEVKELYLANNKVIRLVKREGGEIFLPALLLDKALTTLIIDEVTHYLLPGMLASYERGETIAFGDLEVNQKGIYRPGGMVYWNQIGDIALEKQTLSVYYSELDHNPKNERQNPITFAGKWHIWRKSAVASVSWPNLPILVALVNAILDQLGVNQVEVVSFSQQPITLKEIAALAKRKKQRKTRMAIALTIISLLTILSLAIGIPVYQSVLEQQRAERDTQLLLNYFTQRAHKPYTVQVPGEHCGNGKEYWLDDDSTNVYACQKDGLLMTQKNFQYQDGEYFTFVSDTLSVADAFSSGHYFPHTYRVQVNATIVSGGPGTCVAVEVHIQDFQGRQEFDVCADGSWNYSRCDLHCNTDTQVANGNLPHASNTYLIAVDVTDNVLTLYVDHARVTAIQDSAYSSTDQLELALYGDQNAGEPITARFADFSYTPLP